MSDRRLFALSDPHLSFARPKPMGVFGPHWDNHAERLAANWRRAVRPGDIVLVPGDISWAMRLEDARADLEWLAALPGRKVLLRGNHDYWWQSLGKLAALGLPDMHFIQNNYVVLDGVAIGGTRLWDFSDVKWGVVDNADNPDVAPEKRTVVKQPNREEDPEKIRIREIARLSASLAGLPREAKLRVAMTHYPPLGENGRPTPLTDLIGGFGVDICVFGHIHSAATVARPGTDIIIGQTRYILTASDHLGHEPLLVTEV